jgi:hypothetical protein
MHVNDVVVGKAPTSGIKLTRNILDRAKEQAVSHKMSSNKDDAAGA